MTAPLHLVRVDEYSGEFATRGEIFEFRVGSVVIFSAFLNLFPSCKWEGPNYLGHPR